MLGTKSRYAVTAMLDLAKSSDVSPVRLSEIASRQKLPEPYLEQLFSKLRRAGLVESTRGQKGGYRLARAAQDINVSEVIKAVDDELKARACASRQGCRQQASSCLTHDLWAGLESHVDTYLSTFSLRKILEKQGGEALSFKVGGGP